MLSHRIWVAGAVLVLLAACGPATASNVDRSPTALPSPTPSPELKFWSEKGVALTAGDFGHPEMNGQLGFADSEIVRLPDGRARIYMGIGSPKGSGPGAIGSMVSTDGLHWTLEPGNRCSQTCGQIGVAQLPGGGWRIFANGEGGIRSATSADGLKWVDDSGLRISNSSFAGAADEFLSGPHLIAMAGGWRMYFHKGSPSWHPEGNSSEPAPRILSAFSSDLMNWTPDPGVRATGLQHPNVIALAGGGYQMFGHAGFPVVTATSSDGLTWPATFTNTGLQGGDPVPLRLPDGSIRLYYNDADAITHKGGGLFWAEQETVSWDVAFGGDMIDVTGTGAPVTVRLTDHGRSQDRPASGLPHTQMPPFSLSVQLGGGNLPYQPVIEVSDGTMNRFIDGYSCVLANERSCPPVPTHPSGSCTPGTFCPGQPDNCGPGQKFACPSPAVPCEKGQPIPSQGCITAGYDGLPRLCMPKGIDPSAPPICQQFY